MSQRPRVPIPTDSPVWASFFTVAPLVLVATREPDGRHDIAPKHMAMPLGWQNHYCFVCSPRHATYVNAVRTGEFTVSFPTAEQVIATSLAASPREKDGSKPSLAALETVPARVVDGVLVAGAYLTLECRLDRAIDGFGEDSIVAGEIVAASVRADAARGAEVDDQDLLAAGPLLAYLSPGRFASVGESRSFPFPLGSRR
ncbi:MAG TPA: flavin reductase [Gaiellaceae bacterium]|nr:flavin reductase [Gaiellaceae bacterium]